MGLSQKSTRPLTSALAAALVTVLLVSSTASATPVTGQNGCTGIDLSSSKYCSAFAPTLLGPTSYSQQLIAMFATNTSSQADPAKTQYLQSLGLDAISSAADFDTRVFEQQVLANLSTVNNVWFRCPYQTRGVQLSLTMYCGMLLNGNPISNAPVACLPTSAPVGTAPGLCNSSTTKSYSDGAYNYEKDASCAGLDIPKAKLAAQTIYSALQRAPDAKAAFFSNQSATCVDAAVAEGKFGMCGWPTRYAACQNGCVSTTLGNCASVGPSATLLPDSLNTGAGGATGNNGSTTGGDTAASNGSSILAIVLGTVGAVVLVGALGVAMFMYRRRRIATDMQTRAEYMRGGNTDPGYTGFGAGSVIKAPAATASGNPAAYTMDVPTVGRMSVMEGSPPNQDRMLSDAMSGGGNGATQLPPLTLSSLPLALPSSPLGGNGGTASAPQAAADAPLRRPPSTKLSTLTPPPRTSFYERDDLESIAPEDSASNVGINPRYRPGLAFRPPSNMPAVPAVPGGSLGVPGAAGAGATAALTAAATAKPSPLAKDAQQQQEVMQAEARAAVGTLPAVGRVVLGTLTAHRVFHTYHPKLGDELAIGPGDVLNVDLVFSDGWGQGFRVDPTTGAKIGPVGVFPVAALEPVVTGSAISGSQAAAAAAAAAQQQQSVGSNASALAKAMPLPQSPGMQ
ncbi:hypothetical protein BC828DRAFT_371867 [Blastocladiella britannica]|nr:hypothetical protein BC828DRAFT_371867 [Blastocladiella britannica]